jgi:hypothetical protein
MDESDPGQKVRQNSPRFFETIGRRTVYQSMGSAQPGMESGAPVHSIFPNPPDFDRLLSPGRFKTDP